MTSGKFSAFKAYKTERNMNKVFVPVITHFFYYLKPLCKMKVLVDSRYINTFMEIVCFLSVKSRCNISCGIKCTAVTSYNKARRHTTVLKVNYHSTVAFFKKVLFFKFFNNGVHFVIIEAFACISIKLNAENIVNSFKFFYG